MVFEDDWFLFKGYRFSTFDILRNHFVKLEIPVADSLLPSKVPRDVIGNATGVRKTGIRQSEQQKHSQDRPSRIGKHIGYGGSEVSGFSHWFAPLLLPLPA